MTHDHGLFSLLTFRVSLELVLNYHCCYSAKLSTHRVTFYYILQTVEPKLICRYKSNIYCFITMHMLPVASSCSNHLKHAAAS
jgi:hypothetical protein